MISLLSRWEDSCPSKKWAVPSSGTFGIPSMFFSCGKDTQKTAALQAANHRKCSWDWYIYIYVYVYVYICTYVHMYISCFKKKCDHLWSFLSYWNTTLYQALGTLAVFAWPCRSPKMIPKPHERVNCTAGLWTSTYVPGRDFFRSWLQKKYDPKKDLR